MNAKKTRIAQLRMKKRYKLERRNPENRGYISNSSVANAESITRLMKQLNYKTEDEIKRLERMMLPPKLQPVPNENPDEINNKSFKDVNIINLD